MQHETRLQHISRFLELLCLAFILIYSARISFYIFQVATDGWEMVRFGFFAQGNYYVFPEEIKWAGIDRPLRIFVLNLVYFVLLTYSTWRLSKMFSLLRLHEVFTIQGANHLYVFSVCSLLIVLLNNLESLLVFMSARSLDPFSIALMIFNVFLDALIPITFLIISWIIREGVAIRSENEAFV